MPLESRHFFPRGHDGRCGIFWRGVVLVITNGSGSGHDGNHKYSSVRDIVVGRAFGVMPMHFLRTLAIGAMIWFFLDGRSFGALGSFTGERDIESTRLMGVNVGYRRRSFTFVIVGLDCRLPQIHGERGGSLLLAHSRRRLPASFFFFPPPPPPPPPPPFLERFSGSSSLSWIIFFTIGHSHHRSHELLDALHLRPDHRGIGVVPRTLLSGRSWTEDSQIGIPHVIFFLIRWRRMKETAQPPFIQRIRGYARGSPRWTCLPRRRGR